MSNNTLIFPGTQNLKFIDTHLLYSKKNIKNEIKGDDFCMNQTLKSK